VGADSGNAPDLKAAELTAIIHAIQERVRSRHPTGQVAGLGVPLPDLMPIVHARDAAEAKVAAIGTVNPRAGGAVNSAIQFTKRQIARGMGWFVRDQVQFNRAVMGCIESLLMALNESNRTMAALAARSEAVAQEGAVLRQEATELKDVRVHWMHWREEWEHKLLANEVRLLRGVADLQLGFQHRALAMESTFRDAMKAQHADFVASSKISHAEFTASIAKSIADIQSRFRDDMERIRADYDRLIHTELRLIRQRAMPHPEQIASAAQPSAQPSNTALAFDYARFAERFRGSEEYVRNKQSFYVPQFAGCAEVLDIGCGRGEFLQVMKEAGIAARGIDLDNESVSLCRAKGLQAETADLFTYLNSLPDAVLDGVFSAQVIEHLPPESLPELVRLVATKLRRGGVVALETPNPECLAIFASHFYLDPTHTRPVPPPLLVFYLEEFGFGNVEVHRMSPAVETMPSLNTIPAEFREAFFGSLDYAVVARKLL
jgi:2-polyprenyl-3-methyl-5-hydroxy-6-metoxy-1,4-benzoquinol methylase